MSFYIELEDDSGDINLEVADKILLDLIVGDYIRRIKPSQSETEIATTTINITAIAVLN